MSESGGDEIRLIVGLGNPGQEYANTRHNVGADVVRLLAEENGVQLRRHRSRTYTASVRLGTLPGGAPGPKVDLALSSTFMNVSGGPISRLAEFLGLTPRQVLVVHDDVDLPAYALRLKRGGGEGGHNGLRSLSQHFSSRDYARLRIGVGRPPGRQDTADYVLAQIPARDRPEWDVTIAKAAEVAADVVVRGLAAAQQDLHSQERNSGA